MNNYGDFNPDVLKDLSKIHEKMEEERNSDKTDKKKLLELEMQQLYRGMELNSGTYNNWRRNIPW